MDDKDALHTAARRYCMERESEIWRAIEAKVVRERNLRPTSIVQALWNSGGLDACRDVIQGILRRIEGATPAAFPSREALQVFLLETGREASLEEDTRRLKEAAGWQYIEPASGTAGTRAEKDERARFSAFVEGLSPENLRQVQPLPRHRLLGEHEAERLWRRLARKWQMPEEGYWWPLGPQEAPPPHVLAFNDWEFDAQVPLPLLKDWLRKARARPILLFDADNPGEDYEMDLEFFKPYGTERYWTSPKMDWVIYRSHEQSTAVGGEWLLNLVKQVWPEWDDHVRTTHMPTGLA